MKTHPSSRGFAMVEILVAVTAAVLLLASAAVLWHDQRQKVTGEQSK